VSSDSADFDARHYGYKKLSELLDASSYFEARPINTIVMGMTKPRALRASSCQPVTPFR